MDQQGRQQRELAGVRSIEGRKCESLALATAARTRPRRVPCDHVHAAERVPPRVRTEPGSALCRTRPREQTRGRFPRRLGRARNQTCALVSATALFIDGSALAGDEPVVNDLLEPLTEAVLRHIFGHLKVRERPARRRVGPLLPADGSWRRRTWTTCAETLRPWDLARCLSSAVNPYRFARS